MNTRPSSLETLTPAQALGVPGHWPERDVPDRWRRPALQWLIWSAWPVTLVLLLQAPLLAFWQWTMGTWSRLLGLPDLVGRDTGTPWRSLDYGAFAPSSHTLGLTLGVLLLIWVGAGHFSDRFHPLKVTVRALCLIQLTACLYFAFSPASFPYTVSAHLQALFTMGYGFMLAIPPMLALGLAILELPWSQKVLAPLGVLTYFALMLPHKFMLHIWVLAQGSILFMPLLFWTLGSLMDLWIFIALYGWLVSQLPAQSRETRRKQS